MSIPVKTPHIFGIRHLSPGGAMHLRKFLDEKKPTAVLIEGLSDANSQLKYLTYDGTTLPVAILAYTEEFPVRTLLTPFAVYSPEYQAILWANENRVHCEFIDLPSDVFIALEYQEFAGELKPCGNERDFSVYEALAEYKGDKSYESYWERDFEHNLNNDAYRLAIYEFGKNIRGFGDSRPRRAENTVREAFMRRRIIETIHAGHSPDKIVVVTGAYHSEALDIEKYEPITDAEYNKLPKIKTNLTLMPYSYLKLTSRSGYGAGNDAPLYFEMMWNSIISNNLERLPAIYLTNIASFQRQKGFFCSSADVIEGVRLANTLAALNEGSAPTLADLRDAAIVCLGHGQKACVMEAIAATEIGTKIGNLPEGISRTSLQDDFYRELKRLKMEKYKSAVSMELALDLRENRRVMSNDAAFLDLSRSKFLHRLRILNISFQKMLPVKQDSATWAESWVLQWSPEAEIALVESTLKGETIELAVAFCFREDLENISEISQATRIIKEACLCGMPESMEHARGALQAIAVETGAFNQIACAAFDLSMVISYGSIRKFETEHFEPLLAQLFLRGSLLLNDASNCDNNASKEVLEAIHKINTVSFENHTIVNEETWIKSLFQLARRDDRNPKLSGYACSILLERNLISTDDLSAEVSRRLSPGIDADLGSGWFEGLSMRNKYLLITKLSLWKELSNYIIELDDEQFKRALVFLRRAFADFGPNEKRSICDNLGEIWGVNSDNVIDFIEQKPLTSSDGLDVNEFDFGDI